MAREKIKNINVGNLPAILSAVYRAKIPILIIGHKGIGKSEIVKQFCNTRDLNYIDIRLAYMEAQDIVGFPSRDEKTGTMTFAPPDWLPMDGRGILFLDEINRARIDVLQAVFQLVRDREIGGIRIDGEPYRLPEGWIIAAAMNPDTENEQYYVSPIDESLYDRFLKVGIEYDPGQFREFAGASPDFHKTVKSFINDNDLEVSRDPMDILVDATPRSFELFSRVYAVLEEDEMDILSIIGEGLIGPANTVRFSRYLEGFFREVNELIENILLHWKDDESLRKKIARYQDDRHDIIIAVRDRFLTHYINEEGVLHDLERSGALENFIRYVFSLSSEQVVANLIALRDALGGEYVSTVLKIVKTDEDLNERYEGLIERNPDHAIRITI